MHIDHKAGDKVYVDYAGEKLYFVNPQTGEVISVEVFLAILGASQLDIRGSDHESEERRFYRFLRAFLSLFWWGSERPLCRIILNQRSQKPTNMSHP